MIKTDVNKRFTLIRPLTIKPVEPLIAYVLLRLLRLLNTIFSSGLANTISRVLIYNYLGSSTATLGA